jgi:hypothetical protein
MELTDRHALVCDQVSVDPPFDPPREFMANHPSQPASELWRTKERFPDLCAEFDWLDEMLSRLNAGIPPVSEAEFAELSAWFKANDAALYAMSRPSELLDVGGGRQTWCANVQYYLAKGPRAEGSGRVAEDVRQLKARCGSQFVLVGSTRSDASHH